MILTASNIVEYLRTQGLCRPPTPDEAPWHVAEITRRNHNFAVAPPAGGPGFFIKQLRVQAPASLLMMQREATVYWLAHHDPDFEALRRILPPFYRFDGHARVVILGLLPHAQNLMQCHQQLAHFPAGLGRRLGQALAVLHRYTGRSMRTDPPRQAFPLEVPGIFTAHRNGPLVQWLNAGQMRLIDQIRTHPRLAQHLDTLASTWTFETFTHGDVKFENSVTPFVPSTSKATSLEESPLVKLVDWELADFGDPCWDVGAALQAYLALCIRSAPPHEGFTLDERLRTTTMDVATLPEAAGGFWRQYCTDAGLDEAARPAFLERALRCAAARLLQMALEVMFGHDQPTPMAHALFEAGIEGMDHPLPTARLLGIDTA